VVLYHFWPDVLALFPWSAPLTPMASKGGFAVPAFFILSGVVLAHNYGSSFHQLRPRELLSFLVRRLARIYPVHFVSLIAVLGMVVVIRALSWEITDSGYTLESFVLNVLLIHTWVPQFSLSWNYPSWSISSEWFAYIMFGPAMILCNRLSARSLWAGVVLSVVLTVALLYSPVTTPYRELLAVVPTFMLGATFTLAWARRTGGDASGTPGRMPAALIVFWLPMAIVASCFLPVTVYPGALFIALAALVLALYVTGQGVAFPYAAVPLVFLGEISYSLYMTHALAQKILYKIAPVQTYAAADLMTRLGVASVYLSVIAVGTVAMFYLVEKPARRLVARRQRAVREVASVRPEFSTGTAVIG